MEEASASFFFLCITNALIICCRIANSTERSQNYWGR